MTTPTTWILGAALAGSLVINLLQWRAGRSSSAAPAAETTSATPAPSTTGQSPVVPPAAAPKPSPASAMLAESCPRQVAALAERLSDAEQKLEERLSMSEKFEQAAPAPAVEERVRPVLEKVLAGAPDGVSWDVECQGQVCRLSVTARDSVDYDWEEKVQSREMRQIAGGMAFKAPRPGQDPLTKEPIQIHEALLQVNDARAASGAAILDDMTDRLAASGVYAACSRRGGEAGYVALQLVLDVRQRRIEVHSGGTLASSPAGRCVVEAFETAAAQVALPQVVLSATRYAAIELPQ